MRAAVLSLALTLTTTACTFQYAPADPQTLKQFLTEEKILGATDEQTITALIDWSRHHLVHMLGPLSANPPSIQELLDQYRREGKITIDGCWGTVDFFRQLLGSVGIPVDSATIDIDGKLHARAVFPSIHKLALHGDDLHAWEFSKTGHEVPSAEILVAEGYEEEHGGTKPALRAHETELIRAYLPDSAAYYRLRSYGKLYTPLEIRHDLDGTAPIDDVTTDPAQLARLDARIDELGGPDSARAQLLRWLEFP